MGVISGTVGRIMRVSFVAADPGESLESARQTMRLARLRHLLVTRDERLLGVLSYRVLLEALVAGLLAARGGVDGQTVADVMTRDPVFVTRDTPLYEAADRLCLYGLGCLPVLEASTREGAAAGRVVGIVTEADLLRAAFARREH
jgi:CBS domain-containing protein